MDKLREEIIAAQQARSDFLKWKLVIVSVLGGAGLGSYAGIKAPLVILALIPFAALYVDVICYHLALRTIVIGSFFKSIRPSDTTSVQEKLLISYEAYAFQTRGTKILAFDLEDWALWQSTFALSLIVLLSGISDKITRSNPEYNATLTDVVLIGSGIFGMWLSYSMFKRFKSKCAALEEFMGCSPTH